MVWPAVFIGIIALAAMGDTSPTTTVTWGFGFYSLVTQTPEYSPWNNPRGIVYYV